jgi:hypothetical protein
MIRKLYKGYRKVSYTLNYSAAKKEKGEELMIFSDNINIVKKPVIPAKKTLREGI